MTVSIILILLRSVHQNLDGIGEENEPMDTEVHVATAFVVCSVPIVDPHYLYFPLYARALPCYLTRMCKE